MRKITLFLVVILLSLPALNAQENPFLRVEMKRNILGQKIEVLDGPKSLRKEEVTMLLSTDPDALFLYEKARRKQNITTMLSALEVGLFIGSAYFIFAPQPQSSKISNLFWPISIGSIVASIASGAFRREAGNLTREAIDVYNFGNQAGAPVYFQENNRIDQTIFSFRIPIR
ncbi:hypothetical protein [Algoriphagus sp.]|uniref:hypothetical protein n=1 Tax=Algoriphagus sp. TaxID=1872435 RepID=UPI00391D5AB3